MKTIDLNRTFTQLDGKPGDNLSQVLATVIAQSRETNDPQKYWGWAQTLWRCEPLTLDDSDFTKFRDFVTNTPIPVLIRGQLLELINETKGK